MSKQIFVCMDGTWNNAVEQTNVHRLFQMLPGTEQAIEESGPIRSHLVKRSPQVVAYYLAGMGKGGRQQGLLSATHGISLHDSVIDGYLLLSQVYERGDKIWFFGFSRGAWAARTLAAFVARSGLLSAAEADDDDAADEAERIWLNYREGLGKKRGARFWRYYDETPIRMVGVWDTVGELGLPLFNGLRLIDRDEVRLLSFADGELSARVEHGRQALAIDEERADFTPTLWGERPGIKQVWFVGAHGDVGGGYESSGLADIALAWMVQEAHQVDPSLGLVREPCEQALFGDFLHDRHDETRGAAWRTRPKKERKLPQDAELHPSVLLRLQQRLDYRPQALQDLPACADLYRGDEQHPEESVDSEREPLPFRKLPVDGATRFPVYAHKWWNASGVEVDVGERYHIAASGTWIDKKIPAGADGYESSAWLQQLAEGSRRMEDRPWFALIAAVHPLPDLEGSNPASENMLTGFLESAISGVARIDAESALLATSDGCELEIAEPGFLYFFANDSAFAYANNSGFLAVEVTRLAGRPEDAFKPLAIPEQVPGSLDLRLHFAPGVASLAVCIALYEAGLAFDLVPAEAGQRRPSDGDAGAPASAGNAATSLEVQHGVLLREVPAMLLYIADRVPESELAPELSTLERYRLQDWLAYLHAKLHVPLLGAKDEARADAERACEELRVEIETLAACLDQGGHLLGDRFTIADGYLFSILTEAIPGGIDLRTFPSLLAFAQRIGQRQSIAEALRALGGDAAII